MGIPVLTSAEGGLSEIITDGVNGRYTEFRTAEGAAKEVMRLWSTPELYKRMQTQARLTFEQRFAEDAYYERLMDALRHAAARRPTTGKEA